MVIPLSVNDAVGSISLTSGSTIRLIVSSLSTVGVNARLTPNVLNSTVIAAWPLLPPPPPAWATGIGNSPPARNEARSPESAIRVGWAKVRARPLDSIALRIPVRLRLPSEIPCRKIPF